MWNKTLKLFQNNFIILLLSSGRHAQCCGQPVYLCVCLSASIYLGPSDWSARNFVWAWLGPSLAALRYVMYFRFYGWCHGLAIMGATPKGGGWTVQRRDEWRGDTRVESNVYECCFTCNHGTIKQVTWLASPRSEAQVHICLLVCGIPWWVFYNTVLCCDIFFIIGCGIVCFRCAMRVLEVQASSSFPRLPLCQISFLSQPALLS